MKTVSKYTMGLIGLRVQVSGRATELLRKDGWVRMHPAEINNRNGFNWVRWLRTKEEFQAMDWKRYQALGLEAVAVWITDAQWAADAAITDTQWRNRKAI